MPAPKAGWKGAVYIGAQKIGGATAWSFDGKSRQMQAIDEFEDEHIMEIPLQIIGGSVTITGQLKMGDAGQVLLESRLSDGAQITDLKLYVDKASNKYYTPDPAILMTVDNVPSHAIVTTAGVGGVDKNGIGTFSATLKINGELKIV